MGINPKTLSERVQKLIAAQANTPPAINTLVLPWPPSVNHYWMTRRGGGRFISERGREYRHAVWTACVTNNIAPLHGAIAVSMTLAPPDHRRRDIDNVFKAMFDALQHGGCYADDSQIKRIEAEMVEPNPPGVVTVTLWAINGKGSK